LANLDSPNYKVHDLTKNNPTKEKDLSIATVQPGLHVAVVKMNKDNYNLDLSNFSLGIFTEISYSPLDHAKYESSMLGGRDKDKEAYYFVGRDSKFEQWLLERLLQKKWVNSMFMQNSTSIFNKKDHAEPKMFEDEFQGDTQEKLVETSIDIFEEDKTEHIESSELSKVPSRSIKLIQSSEYLPNTQQSNHNVVPLLESQTPSPTHRKDRLFKSSTPCNSSKPTTCSTPIFKKPVEKNSEDSSAIGEFIIGFDEDYNIDEDSEEDMQTDSQQKILSHSENFMFAKNQKEAQ
jgi:hypothetical protein